MSEEGLNSFATVGEVYDDGVTLIFDGTEDASEKHYKGNVAVSLSAGDRVKLTSDSGTYVVDYKVGVPGSEASTGWLPTGGSEGQYLKKSSADDYDVSWVTLKGLLPTGGSDGQVLTKSGANNYSVVWKTPTTSGKLPTGGSAGQYLKKSSADDYDAEWASLSGLLPTGGTAGQFLKKTSATDYAVSWSGVSATALVSGSYTVQLSSAGLLYPTTNRGVSLGSSSYRFNDLYVGGSISLGYSSTASKLGFFGTTPVARKTVASSATVATLITALKAYGLIG